MLNEGVGSEINTSVSLLFLLYGNVVTMSKSFVLFLVSYIIILVVHFLLVFQQIHCHLLYSVDFLLLISYVVVLLRCVVLEYRYFVDSFSYRRVG